MSTLRVSLLATAALAGAFLVPAPAPAATPREKTEVIANCADRSVEPRKVIATCGDGNVYATIASYGSWRRKQALGEGRLHMNDCDPSCAGGTFHSYRATFRLYRVVDTRKGPLFTRLGVTYFQGGEEHEAHYVLPRRPL